MKKLAVLFIGICLLIIGTASAYGLYINCSDKIQVGQPLKVSLDSNFPAGTSFDLVLYESQYTATEISRQTITIQEDKQTQYKLFDTTGLRGGNYKVEIQFHGPDSSRLSSDSVIVKILKIADRSGEITITAPITQNVDEALRIEGSIRKAGNNGVEIEVRGPSGPVFGPQWIETKNDLKSGDGQFVRTIPVGTRGDYLVNFQDINGFIGTITFHVVSTSPTTGLATVSTPLTTKSTTRPPVTTVATTTTTPTKSPLSPLLSLIAISLISGIVITSLTNKNR
ncbi:MAG: hypothetical protein OS112_05970 [Methanoregula sp.]|nr:MAG: hypothetical protein OS112_05970 [Methanoregula sp.]